MPRPPTFRPATRHWSAPSPPLCSPTYCSPWPSSCSSGRRRSASSWAACSSRRSSSTRCWRRRCTWSCASGCEGQVICVLLGPASDSGRRDRPIRTGRRDKPIIQLPSVALRVAIMVGIAVVLFAIILFRLWFLQILSGQQFVVQANDNRLRSVKLVAPRGAITDRNGEVIVENRPGLAVGFRLMDVPNGQLNAEIERLAPVLHTRPGKIRTEIMVHLRSSWPAEIPMTWKKIVAGDGVSYELIVVKEDVSDKAMSYILEHIASFHGVEIRKNYPRGYPDGFLAAHLLGNMGEISKKQLKEQRFKGY